MSVQECDIIRPLLEVYIDREATEGETALVEGHVRTCPRCASELSFLRLTQAVFARQRDVMPPAALTERIAFATYARPSLRERVAAFLRPAPARVALGAAVAAGVALAFINVNRLAEVTPGTGSRVAVGPDARSAERKDPDKAVAAVPRADREAPSRPAGARRSGGGAVADAGPGREKTGTRVADKNGDKGAIAGTTAVKPSKPLGAPVQVADAPPPAPAPAVRKPTTGRVKETPARVVATVEKTPEVRSPVAPVVPPRETTPEPEPVAPVPAPVVVAEAPAARGGVAPDGRIRLSRSAAVESSGVITLVRSGESSRRTGTNTYSELGQGSGGGGSLVSAPAAL